MSSVVLVTGAGRGLGLEFVRQYATDGWTVLATVRDPDRAGALRAVIAQEAKRLVPKGLSRVAA